MPDRTPLQDARHAIIARRESLWYPEPFRVKLLERLRQLATDPVRHRQTSIAIIGEAHSGKSVLAEEYLRLYPPFRGETAMVYPAIKIFMPDHPRIEDFSTALLEAIGAPDPSKGTHNDRMKRFYRLAYQVELGLIFLDEFHDCTRTTGRGDAFLITIKQLMNHKLTVVPIGIRKLEDDLKRDPQLASRFNTGLGTLPRVTDRGHIRQIMAHIAGVDEVQIHDPLVEYVLGETRGVLGWMLDLIETTLTEHGHLTLTTLKAARQLLNIRFVE